MISELKIFLQRKDNLVWFQLFVLFLVFLVLNLLSNGSYGGGDDIVHYRFARYAFKYPSLYLDQWAKPVFTLLASPFAQLGYWGVRMFNVLVGAFTSFVVYKISLQLKLKNGWLAPALLFTVPIYASMLLSGMTEILFGFILVLAVYLVFKNQYIWCAIVVSLFPFSRTETVIFWPAFLFVFVWSKKWKAIPFVFTGSLIYTLIGGLYYHDFLCLYTKMPYTGTYDIYGHGELLTFVKANKSIFGIPQTILFAVGIVAFVISFFHKRGKSLLNEFVLVLSGIFIYYAAHSYVWWKGINSLGLARVMACISPLFVIYVIRGIDQIVNLYHKLASAIKIKRFVCQIVSCFIALITVYVIISTPFKVYAIPVPLPEKEQIVKEAAFWFKNSPYNNRKIYIWDQYFWFFIGIEPLNPQKMADGIPDRNHPEKGVLPGEMVIWDSHLSAVDGRFPLEGIITNPYYKLVKAIVPRHEITVFGHPYIMCFFERLDSASASNNIALLDSFKMAAVPVYKSETLSVGSKDGYGEANLSGEIRLAPGNTYFNLYTREVSSSFIPSRSVLNVSLDVQEGPLILVVSLKHRRNIYFYYPTEIAYSDQWKHQKYKIYLPLPKGNKDELKIYLWNNQTKQSGLKNIKVELLRECN